MKNILLSRRSRTAGGQHFSFALLFLLISCSDLMLVFFLLIVLIKNINRMWIRILNFGYHFLDEKKFNSLRGNKLCLKKTLFKNYQKIMVPGTFFRQFSFWMVNLPLIYPIFTCVDPGSVCGIRIRILDTACLPLKRQVVLGKGAATSSRPVSPPRAR